MPTVILASHLTPSHIPYLMNIRVVILEGADAALPFAGGGNAFGSGDGRGNGRNIRDLKFNRCFADIGVVIDTQFAAGCIDDQMDVLVHDRINDVGPSFMHLENLFGLDSVFCEELMRPIGCSYFVSEFIQNEFYAEKYR